MRSCIIGSQQPEILNKNVAKPKTDMKMQSKPIIAFASGAILLLGTLCQTAQAQSTIATLADSNDGAANLTVDSTVTFDGSVYTYDYTINNPSGGSSEVTGFDVSFNANPANAAFNLTGGDFGGTPSGYSGVNWTFGFLVNPISQGSSALVSFQSDYAPVGGAANATGTDNAADGASWATAPNGDFVYVPAVPTNVPEPVTTSLLALSSLLLVFRPNILKKS
jgi:hypothetical protein